ncbi:MAG: hypothetical protein IJ711_00090 [Lachnospiraceae bacterium]|nr:hypothetical protein [Clostridia bacterium]MBR1691154.1 hypothetical protein [Lachnospiraceae bacterium]
MADRLITTELSVTVTDQDIDDIMVAALEGGINYWCDEAEVIGDYLGKYASDQISRGGKLRLHVIEPFDENDSEYYELDLDKFLAGLKAYLAYPDAPYVITAAKPHGFREKPAYILDCCLVDAVVADMIIQFGLFGEIIYG